MENIPAHIFDWIEQTPYTALTPQQKLELQYYISEEEYTNLHRAAIVATGYAKTGEEAVNPQPDALQQLHTVFDATYPEKKKRFTPIVFWQAAASLLLIAVAALSLGWYSSQHQKPQVITHIKTDTVFVNGAKQMPNEIKIYDTVYLESPRQNYRPKQKLPLQLSPLSNARVSGGSLPNIPRLSDTLFSKESLRIIEQLKRNSVKYDTSIQNFDFVQL